MLPVLPLALVISLVIVIFAVPCLPIPSRSLSVSSPAVPVVPAVFHSIFPLPRSRRPSISFRSNGLLCPQAALLLLNLPALALNFLCRLSLRFQYCLVMIIRAANDRRQESFVRFWCIAVVTAPRFSTVETRGRNGGGLTCCSIDTPECHAAHSVLLSS